MSQVHCRENFFSAVQHSDLDIELDAGTTDDAYMAAVTPELDRLLDEVSHSFRCAWVRSI